LPAARDPLHLAVLSDACQLIGDLAVETFVLDGQPRPPHRRSPRAHLHAWYGYAERWLNLAIAAGLAGEEMLDELTPEAVRPLAVAFDTSPLAGDLDDAMSRGFYGCFHGTPPHTREARWQQAQRAAWRELCMMRSALEFVRGFLEDIPRYRTELDTEHIDDLFRGSFDLLPKIDAPPRMPDWHWWWF
jgi:hypothetical protein